MPHSSSNGFGPTVDGRPVPIEQGKEYDLLRVFYRDGQFFVELKDFSAKPVDGGPYVPGDSAGVSVPVVGGTVVIQSRIDLLKLMLTGREN